ncbi:hypothetical protein PCS_03566 [Desulfocurvibacter africanus PCS]|uniref:DUF1634 domain-containing protein n=1 Tax=Desulfocurvibacter africanus PCS TaxID=1262666 RepID=M5PP48_DESAF|nr:hypothetical protein [Desulfocurvibacter africanus]EMG35739.1 hypothetical protein PCS_03566 [Desulfocurvibacter africanus PCS]
MTTIKKNIDTKGRGTVMADSTKASPEQITYANLLFYGCWGSLALMAVTYAIYVFGLLDLYLPIPKVIELWSQSVGTYLREGNVPNGWGWLTLITHGDFINFLGIAILAGMTLVCFIPLAIAYAKKKDFLYFGIAIAEILILAFAASGIVGGGAH